MIAGIGQTSHSQLGPNRSTSATPKMPSAMPERNRINKNGTAFSP